MEKKRTDTNLLSIKELRKWFGGLMAVNRISFDVKHGEIVALIGPNGAGKTTIFNLITGFHPIDDGEIRFNEKRIDGLNPHKIVQEGIVRTFQNLQVFNHMSVLENVKVGLHLQGHSGMITSALRMPSARQEEREFHQKALHYLEQVGLVERANDLARNLPFGQQRLLEIARALAVQPQLLLLDEPAAGLTVPETNNLDELICRLQENGLTILLVEHDMGLVMGIADRVVVLHYGTKIAEGTPEEVQSNSEVIRAYLGEDWQQEQWSEWQPSTPEPNTEVGNA
ncbi:MAG TPA: ABC transporter ATP-binding protein [Anaerolineales bacterium]